MMQWQLLQRDILLGELSEYDCDQPFFLARFLPGPGWESVRPLFEALAALRGPDPDGTRTVAVVKPLRDLDLTLVPVGGGHSVLQVFKDCWLRIDGSEARLRY
ncbi:hypothetical protein [Streptomyces cylindrosporus]|uniref:Uncharacterized protein n=1 Tax=Streptomyces cylindrosporus TaxID=2927583 RepID=A0ABS9YIA7_9ACTN|nr:hypothetical protein [Streptomyces cylindrosporus]MCI3276949.1 hypothetical protein [Streptomyces cylindrosporus]